MGKGCCYTTSWFTAVCTTTLGLKLCSSLPTHISQDMQPIRRQSEGGVPDVWSGFRKVMEELHNKVVVCSPQTQLWHHPSLLLVHPAVKQCPTLPALASQNIPDHSSGEKASAAGERLPLPSSDTAATAHLHPVHPLPAHRAWGGAAQQGCLPGTSSAVNSTEIDIWWLTRSH